MKIIMPMARLAAVSVSQVLGEPIRGIVHQRERDRQQDRCDVALRLRQRIICGEFAH